MKRRGEDVAGDPQHSYSRRPFTLLDGCSVLGTIFGGIQAAPVLKSWIERRSSNERATRHVEEGNEAVIDENGLSNQPFVGLRGFILHRLWESVRKAIWSIEMDDEIANLRDGLTELKTSGHAADTTNTERELLDRCLGQIDLESTTGLSDSSHVPHYYDVYSAVTTEVFRVAGRYGNRAVDRALMSCVIGATNKYLNIEASAGFRVILLWDELKRLYYDRRFTDISPVLAARYRFLLICLSRIQADAPIELPPLDWTRRVERLVELTVLTPTP